MQCTLRPSASNTCGLCRSAGLHARHTLTWGHVMLFNIVIAQIPSKAHKAGLRAQVRRAVRAWDLPRMGGSATWRMGGACTSSALLTSSSASRHCENTCTGVQ